MYTTLALAIASLVIGGCSNLERSRDLGNPQVQGKTLAMQVCSNCHSVDGNSINPNFPKLAGQQEDYLVAQLTYFRSHNRSDPEGSEYMWGIARKLTDEQIKGLATYFSQQKVAVEGRKVTSVPFLPGASATTFSGATASPWRNCM